MGAARILIVGGGVAGLATAWSLARRGVRGVVLLEKERGLALHSSRKNAAILRTATDDPIVEGFLCAGAEFLRRPPSGFSDRPLLDPCGLFVAAGALGGAPAPWELRAKADGRAVEPEGMPLHFAAEGQRALWFPGEGRIDIEALLAGFEGGARAGGVSIEADAGPTDLLVREGAVAGARLSNGRELRAERTVIAAGGWAGALAAAAGSRVRLRPTRRHLLVTRPHPAVDPRWPIVWVEGDPFYARVEAGGLMLCACDEIDAEPDALAPLAEIRDLALAKAARWLRRTGPLEVARCWSGVRTLTADGRFAIGPDPDVEGLSWAAGLGGHGMACSPVVGEIAAAGLCGEPRTDAAAACDPARLAAEAVPRP
jgi:D-arginine dehydrogenase